ncbi:MAG: hypothetical protein WC222_03535 [Parachlamydiales bacterium]|jgi:hypothetical protein
MSLYISRSRWAIDRVLNGREGSRLERNLEWRDNDLDTMFSCFKRNIKARVSFAVHGIVGTGASVISRVPKVLENAAITVLTLKSSYFYATGRQLKGIFADILVGSIFTLSGVLAPHTTVKHVTLSYHSDDSKQQDYFIKNNAYITRFIDFLSVKDSKKSLVLSPVRAHFISPIRGLSRALQALVKGIYFLATALFNAKPIGSVYKGLEKVVIQTPLYVLAGFVGFVFSSVHSNLNIRRG